MPKPKNVHSHMRDRMMLAKVYAQDGAFHTAARILRELGDDVQAHADWADEAVKALIAKHEAGNAGGVSS